MQHLNLLLEWCRILKKLNETYDLENNKLCYEFIESANKFLTISYNKNKKLTRTDFEILLKINNKLNKQPLTISDSEIENEFIVIELPPGVFELIDINTVIKQKLVDFFTK